MHAENLIWIDLEMTGLSPDENRIIEIATVITDASLNIVAESPVLAIYQPEDVLAIMDEWNVNQHTHSGLLERVRRSHIDEANAQAQILAFLQQYVPEGQSPMCGNSICLDRRFLYRYMPKLERYFHYRLIDVSTVKELAKRWYPGLAEKAKGESKHLALDDIRDSIEELRFYKEHFFRFPVPSP